MHLFGTVLVDDGPEGAVAALEVAVGVVYLLEDHLFDASVIVVPYGGDLYVGGSVDTLDDISLDGGCGTVLVLYYFYGVFLVILRFWWIGSRGVWAGRIRSGFLGPSGEDCEIVEYLGRGCELYALGIEPSVEGVAFPSGRYGEFGDGAAVGDDYRFEFGLAVHEDDLVSIYEVCFESDGEIRSRYRD